MIDITPNAKIVPIILGGDIGAYALGREFHEAYGTIAYSVVEVPIAAIQRSRIFRHAAASSTDPDQVLEAVRGIMAEHPGAVPVLITNSEPSIPAVEYVRAKMPEVASPTPAAEVVAQVSNKDRFCELCRANGLDVPQTERVDLSGTAPIAPSGLPFPVVAKPAYSPEYARYINRGFKKVYFIERQEQLDDLWAGLREAGFAGSFLVQELIGGDDTYMDSITLYIDSAGACTLFGGANVLLEDHAPAMLGNPVAMITTPMDEGGTWEKCARMLAGIGYRGFANFDIKRDPRTGRKLFFEVNPRIGRNSYYNCAAGANPMAFAVEDLVFGRRVKPVRITREILYTLVPVRLLRRYVRDPELAARMEALVRSGEVYDPQRYRADAGWRRMLDVNVTELNQYRKFARYYPKPTETSF